MIPISLSLRNFLSYGEGLPPLDFSPFHVVCISGRNGHGKSALLDAVTWALWGEARKAGSERKPDEGLLRIGATEMQVVFEFDLEGERYRVARNYRKTARGGTTHLELQVFSAEEGGLKTLSEEGSLRKTQDRLNGLLRMTFDTFINSAFILQGRADEFTRRNARERKAILGDILGLSRYDELAALARTHAQSAEVEAGRARERLAEIEAASEQKEEHRKGIEAVSTGLEGIEKELAESETRLEALRAEQARQQQHRQELDGLNAEMSRLGADREEAQAQCETAREEAAARQAVLERRDEILAAAERHRALQAEEAQLQQKLHALRDLEKRQNALEKEIDDARHEVERRLDEWERRTSEAEREIAEADGVLEGRAEIDAGMEALRQAREKEKVWEGLRERQEALERRRRDLERQLEAARSEAQVALNTSREQQRRLEAISAERARLQKAAGAAQEQLEGVRELERERDEIREQGTGLKVRIEAAQDRLGALERDLNEAERQRAALQEMREVRCPLCGSDLDAQHRAEVEAQLAERAGGLRAEMADLEAGAREAEAKREEHRRRYQEVKNRLAALAGAADRAARAGAALKEAQKAAADVEEVRRQVADLEARAGQVEASGPEARALGEVCGEIDALGYDPEAHRALREQLEGLREFEARKAHLQPAEERRRKAAEGLPEAREKRDLAREWLEDRRYAGKAREALRKLRSEVEALGYDPARYQQVIQGLEELRDAAGQRERLQAAEREMSGAQARLSASEKRIGVVDARIALVRTRISELETAVQSEAATAQEVRERQDRIREGRDERDRLLQERAALQAQYDRCEALEASRDEEQGRLKGAEKEVRVYRELVTAFGKDGIQALIIEQAIPEIEEEANRILSRLTDNRTQITLESLRDLKKGGTRETLDIKIGDELGERSYELYSGGEAFRVDFAIRIALSKLLARRAGTRLRTLVIDEGFGTQDTEGLENLVEAIQAISEDFEKILVITHVEALKAAFPVRIEVTKYPDRGSEFEVLV